MTEASSVMAAAQVFFKVGSFALGNNSKLVEPGVGREVGTLDVCHVDGFCNACTGCTSSDGLSLNQAISPNLERHGHQQTVLC